MNAAPIAARPERPEHPGRATRRSPSAVATISRATPTAAMPYGLPALDRAGRPRRRRRDSRTLRDEDPQQRVGEHPGAAHQRQQQRRSTRTHSTGTLRWSAMPPATPPSTAVSRRRVSLGMPSGVNGPDRRGRHRSGIGGAPDDGAATESRRPAATEPARRRPARPPRRRDGRQRAAGGVEHRRSARSWTRTASLGRPSPTDRSPGRRGASASGGRACPAARVRASGHRRDFTPPGSHVRRPGGIGVHPGSSKPG